MHHHHITFAPKEKSLGASTTRLLLKTTLQHLMHQRTYTWPRFHVRSSSTSTPQVFAWPNREPQRASALQSLAEVFQGEVCWVIPCELCLPSHCTGHNFGYLHWNSTRLRFGAHDSKDKVLEERDKEKRSQSRPAVKRRKTKDASTNADYQQEQSKTIQPGNNEECGAL